MRELLILCTISCVIGVGIGFYINAWMTIRDYRQMTKIINDSFEISGLAEYARRVEKRIKDL